MSTQTTALEKQTLGILVSKIKFHFQNALYIHTHFTDVHLQQLKNGTLKVMPHQMSMTIPEGGFQ